MEECKSTTLTMKDNAMNKLSAFIFAALLMFVLGAFSPLPVHAHGGEDHGDAKPIAALGVGPRLATGSDLFDLVALPTAKDGGKLRIYLSDAATNTPVRGAQIEVTRSDTTAKAIEGNGFYELDAPWVKTPARQDLTFAITVGDASDLLIGTLNIPEPAAVARHDSVWDHIFPPGSGTVMPWVFTALGTLGLIGIRRALPFGLPIRKIAAAVTGVMIVSGISLGSAGLIRSIAGDMPLANSVLDQPDTARRLGDGAVFAPRTTQSLLEITTQRAVEAQTAQKTVRLIGQVIPDLNRSGLVQSLLPGRIEAPEKGFYGIGSHVKAGDVLGFLIPRVEFKDQSDIVQTTGDVDRQLALAESKLSRFERLKGVIAESQIIDARIELEGLRKRRASLRPLIPERQILTAPVDGVIAQANVVVGQTVDAQAVLFQIVDPENLWVEALAFDPVTAASIERASREATARSADGREAPLVFSGRGLTLKQQAVPLRFKIKGGVFSIGEPVTVTAPIDEAISAIPLPRSALVRSANGQAIVWIHTAPERFEAKIVSNEPIDADRIGITAGLEPEARVVTRGAELINQIR